MKILLIDNYDSYTYILGHYLWEITGERPWIVKNDSLKIEEVVSYGADAIVLSPGPGHPANARDFGVCRAVLDRMPDTPVLGICLGHQGIGFWTGARVEKAPRVRHGKTSALRHSGSDLFEGIPQGVRVMRYHSLTVLPDSLPDGLQVLATSEGDNQIMALKVRRRPHWGVQFHPESIGTEYGKRLLKNFCALTASFRLEQKVTSKPQAKSSVAYRRLPWEEPEKVFRDVSQSPYFFWLDSSRRERRGRFSVMGSAQTVLMADAGRFYLLDPNRGWGSLSQENSWQWLREIAVGSHPLSGEIFDPGEGNHSLPFPYSSGLFGYLGFEFGRTSKALSRKGSSSREAPPAAGWMPDALLLAPSEFEVWDHEQKVRYAVNASLPGLLAGLKSVPWHGLAGEPESPENLQPGEGKDPTPGRKEMEAGRDTDVNGKENYGPSPEPYLAREDYLKRIMEAKQHIRDGESYEVCLTNEFTWQTPLSPGEHYLQLRKHNPAAYGAFIKTPFGCVLSSSPEQFLQLDNRKVTTEPIKGTLLKSRDPRVNLKLRRELLHHSKMESELYMITDLLRNDLAKVCRPGSIRVRDLKKISELSNVLQLSSRIEGELQEGCTSMDLLQACFPGGSVTGAPKLRTLEIIEKLEGRRRGVYTGSIGYLGWDGALRLNVAIRTLVQKGGRVWAGAGGAIVDESSPPEEWQEVLWKLQAVRVSREMVVDKK